MYLILLLFLVKVLGFLVNNLKVIFFWLVFDLFILICVGIYLGVIFDFLLCGWIGFVVFDFGIFYWMLLLLLFGFFILILICVIDCISCSWLSEVCFWSIILWLVLLVMLMFIWFDFFFFIVSNVLEIFKLLGYGLVLFGLNSIGVGFFIGFVFVL